ncbi:LacI family DNA-binding transcriptional regulator [Herbiconiux sp. UC225_62]|uniref:LacI family DNA-binding transcriptional regulator n=1 Tax=Herbiconiux sp. UC225_62 TaxID=3350168 RepID=UPI0036D2AE5B
MADRVQPVTLTDVAVRAGVSQSTASRVINGSSRTVNPDLAQRVLDAAAELQYAANVQAQAVARGTTSTVALLVSDIAADYFSSMAAAVMTSAEREGLRVTIAVTERRVEREIELVRELRGQHVRAIVLAESGYRSAEGVDLLARELHTFEQTGGRVVVVSRSTLPFDYIDLDNAGGARRLAAALHRVGYTSFHILGGDAGLVATRDRIDGFRAGLSERGIELPESAVTYSEFSWDGAFAAVSRLDDAVLSEAQVLFAVNDEMALGAIAGLRNRGMRIPEDIAVAGFDDIRALRDIVPGLTTVRVPIAEIGSEVMALIAGREPSPAMLPATVVLRESTPRLN